MRGLLSVCGSGFVVFACGAVPASGSGSEPEAVDVLGEAWARYGTDWISEEAGRNSVICSGANASVSELDCRGSYCDDMLIACVDLTRSYHQHANGTILSQSFIGYTTDQNNSYWTNYASDEAPNNLAICVTTVGGVLRTGLMDGIRASGRYSDNISIHCSPLIAPPNPPPLYCGWTAYFSEEQPNGGVLWDEQKIIGLRCRGSYCDEMSLLVCSNNPQYTYPNP